MSYRLFRLSISQISVLMTWTSLSSCCYFHLALNTKFCAWRARGRRDSTVWKWGQTALDCINNSTPFLSKQAGIETWSKRMTPSRRWCHPRVKHMCREVYRWLAPAPCTTTAPRERWTAEADSRHTKGQALLVTACWAEAFAAGYSHRRGNHEDSITLPSSRA